MAMDANPSVANFRAARLLDHPRQPLRVRLAGENDVRGQRTQLGLDRIP